MNSDRGFLGSESFVSVEGVGVSCEDLTSQSGFVEKRAAGSRFEEEKASNHLIDMLKTGSVGDAAEMFAGLMDMDEVDISLPGNPLFFPVKDEQKNLPFDGSVVEETVVQSQLGNYEDDGTVSVQDIEGVLHDPELVSFLDDNPALYEFVPLIRFANRQELEWMLRVLLQMRRIRDFDEEKEQKQGGFLDFLIEFVQRVVLMAGDGVKIAETGLDAA